MGAGVVSVIPIWRACCAQAPEFQAEPEAGALTPAGKGCCAFDSPDELLQSIITLHPLHSSPSSILAAVLPRRRPQPASSLLRRACSAAWAGQCFAFSFCPSPRQGYSPVNGIPAAKQDRTHSTRLAATVSPDSLPLHRPPTCTHLLDHRPHCSTRGRGLLVHWPLIHDFMTTATHLHITD